MPAKDHFHDIAKAALIKDGWIITDDPYQLKYDEMELYVDLAAEKIIAAEKGESRIAVEVKSFLGPSGMRDLEVSLGQYVLYKALIDRTDPNRTLYLMIRDDTWENVFDDSVGKLMIEVEELRIIVFNAEVEEIVKWVP